MGSYCAIEFDDFHVAAWKSSVPDFMISLFQENERLVFVDEEYPEEHLRKTIYKASREHVLLRLEVMGFDLNRSKAAFNAWLAEQQEMYSEWLADDGDWVKETHDAIQAFTLEDWLKRAPKVLKTQFDADGRTDPVDETDRRMREVSYDDSWLFFESSDPRFVYRLLLEALPDVASVTLDISDLVQSEYLQEDVQLCTEARAPDAIARPVLEPVIIMAEGKSDIRVLETSLAALYPAVTELFSFFDHDELSVDGGASYLLKFLKALSAARMPLRIVAVFDNDAAGRLEFKKALKLSLPSNVTVMCLPDIALAKSYPTVGPQGDHLVDVNGRAVGIELFLGKHNLVDASGTYYPIRWTHYFSGAETYHGEVSDKSTVQANYFTDIKTQTDPNSARLAYSELDQLWRAIFSKLR